MKRAIFASVVCAAIAACGGSSSGGGSPDGGGGGGAGGGGGGGVGGTGGHPPSSVDKIDLLVMVDNSIGMADKQQLLAEALPRLINQLVNPAPVPSTGKPAFRPVTDLHIAVITSSLGGHGADQCAESGVNFNPTQNDHARLMPAVRAGLDSYNGLGFLAWDPGQKAVPPGQSDAGKLANDFAQHVIAAGEVGCGYEAPLEAWYRFLADPEPPLDVVVSGSLAEVTGVDQTVLKQRQDFLRPNSALAIVMLGDESDCSTIDGGFNWIAGQIISPNNTAFHLGRGTSACQNNPNDSCCRPCDEAESSPPAGCLALDSDPECLKGPWNDVGDHPNLRCWQQKRRFGIEFLYPTRRYVEALTQPTICPTWDNSGKACAKDQRVPNPIFAGAAGTAGRDPGLVFLTGIVGVPWQDLATAASLGDPAQLELMSADQLKSEGRWDWLVPKCAQTADSGELTRPIELCDRWDLVDQPDDPLMIQSSSPRSGAHPLAAINANIAPETAGFLQNAVNGHEWQTDDADLEYACIFPLKTPRDCSTGILGCDCDDPDPSVPANPICQSSDGSYSKIQNYAKAYPGTRQLEVLKDVGSQAVVASICPKQVDDPSSSAYGYNAAMTALVARLQTVMPPP